MLFAAASADSTTAADVGLFGFLLGAPVVHFAHGHVGKGFLSMGLRVGMPLALGYGFASAASCSSSDDFGCGLGELVLGILLGAAGASAIDAAAIAREKVRVQPDVTVVPTLGRHKLGLAVGGAF